MEEGHSSIYKSEGKWRNHELKLLARYLSEKKTEQGPSNE